MEDTLDPRDVGKNTGAQAHMLRLRGGGGITGDGFCRDDQPQVTSAMTVAMLVRAEAPLSHSKSDVYFCFFVWI